MRLYRDESDDSAEKPPVGCRLAATRRDYLGAFGLTYRRYLSAGLIRPNVYGLRIAPHQLSRECLVVLAERRAEIVGTVSLTADGENLLPMDRLFPVPMNRLRDRGMRLVEIGCLASVADEEGYRSAIYVELTRAAIQIARDGGYDRMIAAVHPRHARFYARAMGFRRLSGPVRDPRVNGHAAVCVCGDPSREDAYSEPWRTLFFQNVRQPLGKRGARLPDRDRDLLRHTLDSIRSQDAEADRGVA